MENDPILCFQHCEADVNISCLALPRTCPVCKGDIYNSPVKIPPFRLPSPFVTSVDAPHSVVIRPTHGSFLRDYTNGADLHIGITNSRGSVYHFNEKGMNKEEEGWSQCLAHRITHPNNISLHSVWDSKLIDFSANDKWQAVNYQDSSYNCYQFLVEFMINLNEYAPLNLPCALNKAGLSANLILPETTKAAKYISLYRKLLNEKVMVQYNTSL